MFLFSDVVNIEKNAKIVKGRGQKSVERKGTFNLYTKIPQKKEKPTRQSNGWGDLRLGRFYGFLHF